MQLDRRALGLQAETVVADYLEKLGFTILERNLRLGYLELDLVARKRELIAVVEVRYRAPSSRTTGFGSLSTEKRRRLRRAANRLWRQRFAKDVSIRRLRLDAAIVEYDCDGTPVVSYAAGSL